MTIPPTTCTRRIRPRYDDLAALIRAVDGTGLPGGDARFATDAYRAGLETVFDTRTFLRWAGVNILLGSWDNYFATPSNYYLYNSRPDGEPWFTFLPWDYDNSFGIDYVGEPWQYADIVDWPAATERYCARNHAPHRRSRIPLVTNLLRHPELLRYYLDHLEHLLDTTFAPDTVTERIGPDGGGLWDRVQEAAYLESATPHGAPHTGRQFSNDDVFLANGKQFELHRGRRASRRSRTMCGCVTTGPANSSPCCAGSIRAGPAAPASRCRSRRVGGERTHARPPRPRRRPGGRREAPRSQRRAGARRPAAGRSWTPNQATGRAVGFQNSAAACDQRFHAAGSYWLISPPRIGRRRILPWIGSGHAIAGMVDATGGLDAVAARCSLAAPRGAALYRSRSGQGREEMPRDLMADP